MVIVVLLLVSACVIGYLVYVSSESDGQRLVEPPPTEEELLQARLEIAKAERGVDLALAKQESRMASARTKEAIAEALEEGR